MGELHHLDVGCADTSIIISENATYIIDCHNIDRYSNLLPFNRVIKALFITHQHYDHFDGMNFLKDNGYKIDYLIYSPYKRRQNDNSVQLAEWQAFNSLVDFFVRNGTRSYAPYRQSSFDKPWWETPGLKFWVLGPHRDIADSATREIHDACLVIHVKMGDRSCLFTGDSSDTSLSWIANNTTNICGDILHASHHGSLNGADLGFIRKANPTYTVISTQSGVHENVPHPEALARYAYYTKNKIQRTDLGSIKWVF